MIFIVSYLLLGTLLLAESFALGYVLRGTVRAALDHERRRSSPTRLPSKTAFPADGDDKLKPSTPDHPGGRSRA